MNSLVWGINFILFGDFVRMENGLTEVRLVSLPSEVKSLKIVDTNHSNNKDNGDMSSSRTPSPTKKCHEMMFIDDGAASSSSSSATSTKERDKQRHTSGDTDLQANTLQCRVVEPPPPVSPAPPPPLPPTPPLSPEVCEKSPAPSRRLPTVVVLGYQRVVAESQAAAERMHQQQQLLRQGTHPADCSLTLSIGSSGLIDHSLPASPRGRNNRVRALIAIIPWARERWVIDHFLFLGKVSPARRSPLLVTTPSTTGFSHQHLG